MKNKGFTLIELIIVIAIVGIIFAVASSGMNFLSGGATTEQDFRAYIHTIAPDGKPETVTVQCKTMDTDGDGNVRCSGSILRPTEYDAQGNAKGWFTDSITADCGTWTSGCGEVKDTGGW